MKGWPANFCAACGARVATVTIEGRARRRCPRCGWIFYGNPVPAAVALITRGTMLLLTRRARPPYAGTWDLAGGFLEADEDPLDGLTRELREELGMRIRRARFMTFAVERYGRRGFPVLTLIYRVTPTPGPIRAADDVAEARWFPLDRLPFRHIGFPSMRRLLRDYARTATDRSRRRRAGSSRS